MESFFLSESKNTGGQFFSSSHTPQIIKSLNANIVISLYNVKISTGSAFKGGRS